MAVKDESLHHATENLILPNPRKYYRATIEASHWQLRSLVSSPVRNIVYYPSGNNVVALNTKTRERETITKLSFSPRCLTASKEWICCGGDHGNFTAICVDYASSESTQVADADARLPLDLDLPRRSISPERTSTSRTFGGQGHPITADVIKVGTQIVNCITLWSPSEGASEMTYKVPVAVVSNNDCTVSILDVRTSDTLERLTLPDLVNRSVMSPDGRLLATICDDPFLYIYDRKKKSEFRTARYGTKVGPGYEWSFAGRIQLEGQYQGDKSTMRGSFAACFSRSGKYLAVATQYGLISIFDTESLPEPNSLLVAFTSSRPGGENGAIRAMEFSPGPFDLLAWTEASGRVGVADVRTLFLSRQRLTIDSHASGIEKVVVSDRPGEPTIDPRLRSNRTTSPSTPDYLGLDLERRQLRHLTREMLDRDQAALTTEELEVLQAHRIARRQRDVANAAREARDALAEASATLRLGSWNDGPRTTSPLTSTANAEPSGSGERRILTAGLPAALREFVNPDRSAASIRTFISERNRENERRNQLLHEPRRSSMILAAAENAIEQETLGLSNLRGNNEASSSIERLTLTPSRLQAFRSDSPNNPWAEIDAVYRSRFDPPLDRTARLRIEVEDEDRRDREFAHRLRQPWRPLDDLRSLGDRDESPLVRDVLRPDETMGCCWSDDGRILYIGAKDGIHEFHVNLAGRKMFPSLVLR